MTTKTIPEYLEDERHKNSDAELRIEGEAARILPLHHGHHRTAKQPRLDLPTPVETATKARKTVAAVRHKRGAARKNAAKTRNVA